MALEFNADDFKKMTELQLELTRVLRRANDQKLEAAVAAFALIRCARVLLERYPDKAREDLLTVVVAFLRRDDVVVEGSDMRIFQ